MRKKPRGNEFTMIPIAFRTGALERPSLLEVVTGSVTRKELEALLDALLPFAKGMLKDFGEFYPFGGFLKPDGNIMAVLPKEPEGLASLMFDRFFKKKPRNKSSRAIAIFLNSVVRDPEKHQDVKAIRVWVHHIEGYSGQVFYPYRLIKDGITYGKPLVRA